MGSAIHSTPIRQAIVDATGHRAAVRECRGTCGCTACRSLLLSNLETLMAYMPRTHPRHHSAPTPKKTDPPKSPVTDPERPASTSTSAAATASADTPSSDNPEEERSD